MLKWRAAALGHRGGKSEQIQNGFYISSDDSVFVVADTYGKGTVAAGSRLALQAVKQLWREGPPHKTDEPEIQEWLRKAISCANTAIFAAAKDNSPAGLSTNISIGVQSDQGILFVAHVGDTCTFQIRGSKTIRLIADDYSNVQEVMVMMKEWLRRSPEQFHLIGWEYMQRCIGRGETVEMEEIAATAVLANDCIIFGTDGLRRVVNEETVADFVPPGCEPDEVCRNLVQQAVACGIEADFSIIAVKYFDVAE